jgi:hypothetical protein
LRYAKGSPRYKTSNRFWYNFGEFASHDTWKINKPLILQRLKKEIEDKALHLCPFFYPDVIEESVNSLPDYIKVDNIRFTVYHTAEYINGIENIKATNTMKSQTEYQPILKTKLWEMEFLKMSQPN